MLVSYPMYHLPKLDEVYRIWWQSIHVVLKKTGVESPDILTHVNDDLISHWRNPRLLLSQTCGYPFVTMLKGQVKLVGTPIYSARGCEQSYYCSFFIVHEDTPSKVLEDYAGSRFAFNGGDSQSGFNAVRQTLAEQNLQTPFFAEHIKTGSHRNSIFAVGKGQADICAVDCVTYSLLAANESAVLENTRVLSRTKKTPGLPFITSASTPQNVVDQLFNAIGQVCKDESMAQINNAMLIQGIEKVDQPTYDKFISIPDLSSVKL